MSYLEELIARAQKGDMWDSTKYRPPQRSEKNSVETDSFDKMAWAWITDTVPALGNQVDDLGSDFETSPWAYEDLFNLLNRPDPRATSEDKLVEEFRAQAMMMAMIGESDEIGHLRHATMLDEYSTALAMLTMKEKMRKAFENLQEAMDAQQAASAALQKALQDAVNAMASGEGQGEAAEALAQALANAASAQEGAETDAKASASSIQQAADTAADKIEAEQTLMQAYGVGPGELQKMDFEERRTLAERLDGNRISALAKIIGAQRISADAERRRSLRRAPTRTADMRLGKDVDKLIPSERAKMAIPELEEDFWIRFHKRRLRLKRWNSPPQLDRGPVILICDESYSMTSQLDSQGTREAWSKAIALALCDQARRGKRDFIYIGFASAGEMWISEFPGGKTPLDKVIEFTEHFFGGGTHYERPLNTAMNIVLEYARSGRPKPDLVLLTDDECRVTPEFVESFAKGREEAQVRCYGIRLGGTSREESTMQSLTDRCMDVNQLNASPEGMTELFRSM